MLNNLPASLADLVDRFDKLLENMKKEYLRSEKKLTRRGSFLLLSFPFFFLCVNSLSSLWRAQTYELSALDELGKSLSMS